MALSSQVLKDALKLALAEPFPKDTATAAANIAKAYNTYAVSAMAGAYPFTPVGKEKAALEKALADALSTPVPPLTEPAAVAAGFVLGLTNYWTAAPFTPAIAAPPTGGPILLPALTLLLLNNNNSLDDVANALGDLLHACTVSVIATDASTGATFPLA